MTKCDRLLPVLPLIVLVGFVLGMQWIAFVLTARDVERTHLGRHSVIMFLDAFRDLREDLTGAANRHVLMRDKQSRRVFAHRLAVHRLLHSSCWVIGREGLADPDQRVRARSSEPCGFLLEAAGRMEFLPAEIGMWQRLMEASQRMLVMEQAAMDLIGASEEDSPDDHSLGGLGAGEHLEENRRVHTLHDALHDMVTWANHRMEIPASGYFTCANGLVFGVGLAQVVGILGVFLVYNARFLHMERRAFHDALTELPNRLHLELYLNWVCARAAAHGEVVILAFIDLNGFKPINDSLGHESGDHLLKYIADQLKAHCRSGDMAARFGGDEFVLVMVAPANRRHQSIERMHGVIHATFDDACRMGSGLGFGAAVGISVYPPRGGSPTDLIQQADQAMYRAKQHSQQTGQPLVIMEYQKQPGNGCVT